MADEKKGEVPTSNKVKMVTAGNWKSGGVVFPPGSEVVVTTDDILANPKNFSKPAKKVVTEAEK